MLVESRDTGTKRIDLHTSSCFRWKLSLGMIFHPLQTMNFHLGKTTY